MQTPYGSVPDQDDEDDLNPNSDLSSGMSAGAKYLRSSKIQPFRTRMDFNNADVRNAYIAQMQAQTAATNEGIRRSQMGGQHSAPVDITPIRNSNTDSDQQNDGTNVNRLNRFMASQSTPGPNQRLQGNTGSASQSANPTTAPGSSAMAQPDTSRLDAFNASQGGKPQPAGSSNSPATPSTGGTPTQPGSTLSSGDINQLSAPLNAPSASDFSSLNPPSAQTGATGSSSLASSAGTPPPSGSPTTGGVPPIVPMQPPNTSRLDAFIASQKPAGSLPTSTAPTPAGAAPLIPAGASPSSTAATGLKPPSASGPDQPAAVGAAPGVIHSWDPNSASNLLRSQRFNALNSTIANATGGNPSPSPTPSSTPKIAGGDDDANPNGGIKITPTRLNQSAVSGAGMAFA